MAEGNSGWLVSGGSAIGISCRPWSHVATEGSGGQTMFVFEVFGVCKVWWQSNTEWVCGDDVNILESFDGAQGARTLGLSGFHVHDFGCGIRSTRWSGSSGRRMVGGSSVRGWVRRHPQ